MTAASAALWVATLAGGAAAVGLVRGDLRLWERMALSVVVGIVASAALTYAVALLLGLGATAVALGPVLLVCTALVLGPLRDGPSPLQAWRDAWQDARARPRESLRVALVAAVALLIFAAIFAKALYERDGSIVSGYPTVWADWSLHSTLASSFSNGHNIPPGDPIFSGASLRYPFLPDFQAATLQVAGDSVGQSLATPGLVLCVAITVLIVSLALRLCGSVAVGALAVVICVLGGSLGFTGVWWDACHAAGHGDDACSPVQAVLHPQTITDTLGQLPAVVRDPPRAYDNLQNSADQSVGNVQWYTPLLAWWLPQRTFLYGFAIGLSVLLLVVSARGAPPGTRTPFVLAGLLAGLLPLVHVHTLFALLIVLPLLWLGMRRREWWWLVGAAALLAVPRLVQVALGGHGVPDPPCGGGGTGTQFPYFEPGWMYLEGSYNAPAFPNGRFDVGSCAVTGRFDATPAGMIRALGDSVRVLGDGRFWWFWLFNNGAVVVLALSAGLGALLRRLPGAGGAVGRAVAAPFRWVADAVPPDLLRFCMPFLAVFGVCNLVVFQTWDWDDTKLLAYWYLGGALITAAVLVRMLRSGVVLGTVATLVAATLFGSAALNLHRYSLDPNSPFTWASADDRSLAEQIRARTDPHAVFLTAGNPTDPALTLAGRTAVSGYAGWLYSYGTDLGTTFPGDTRPSPSRPQDIATMLAGCPSDGSPCAVRDLLREYRVDYVEMCQDRGNRQCAGMAWYEQQGYPVVAGVPGTTVYDVRRP